MGDICENCFEIRKKEKIDLKVSPFKVIKTKEKNEIDNLAENLTGVTKEYSANELNSDSSKTSSFNSSNEDHFEIIIRYGHQEKKFKVKKKYTVSKVITKFIDLEKPQEVQGRLMLEGVPLELIKTLGELGISENDTLDLV